MSQVTFDEENSLGGLSSNQNFPAKKESKLSQFFVNHGLAKDAKSANVILVVMALLFFAISLFFFVRVFGGNDSPPPTPGFGPESQQPSSQR